MYWINNFTDALCFILASSPWIALFDIFILLWAPRSTWQYCIIMIKSLRPFLSVFASNQKLVVENDGLEPLPAHKDWLFTHVYTPLSIMLTSSLGHSQILSGSRGENREKVWDQIYITNQKWWTRLVQSESMLCTDRVTISSPWCSFDHRPSPNFSPRLRDKIWEGPGDEATIMSQWVVRICWVQAVKTASLQVTTVNRTRLWLGKLWNGKPCLAGS